MPDHLQVKKKKKLPLIMLMWMVQDVATSILHLHKVTPHDYGLA
jgi:hypothetical protein